MFHAEAIINKKHLINNLNYIKKYIGDNVSIMPVVKANAYGHGSVHCASALEKHGCNSFAVFSMEEGIELRDAGIKSDIFPPPLITFSSD